MAEKITYQEYRERELAKRAALHAKEEKKRKARERQKKETKRESKFRIFMEHEMEEQRVRAERKEAAEKERRRLMHRLSQRRRMFKIRRRKRQREWYAVYRIKRRILEGKEVFYTEKERKKKLPRTVYNIYKYRIVVTRDKKKSRVIMSSNDLEQVTKRFDEILKSNKTEGLCYQGHPLYSDRNSYEVLMVQRNTGDPTDDGVRHFRNRYGVYMPAVTEGNRYTILRKEEWRVPITYKFRTTEETIGGVTCRDLMDEVFSRAVSNDTMITVFLDSNKLYLDNGDFLACVQAKTRADAFQLYTTLVEENVKNKYVVFAGRYRKDISFLAERLSVFS